MLFRLTLHQDGMGSIRRASSASTSLNVSRGITVEGRLEPDVDVNIVIKQQCRHKFNIWKLNTCCFYFVITICRILLPDVRLLFDVRGRNLKAVGTKKLLLENMEPGKIINIAHGIKVVIPAEVASKMFLLLNQKRNISSDDIRRRILIFVKFCSL